MKVSASIELVWQLAAREAIAAEFKEIEPEHVLAAVLKFAELPPNDLEKLGAGAEVVKVLTADVNAVREELEQRMIDSTRARRELRSMLGKGGSPFPGGTIHRSQVSRGLFDAAAKLADDDGNETLTVKHLLDAVFTAPTPKIEEVLKGSLGAKTPKPSKTVLLDAAGQDLTRLSAEAKLTAPSDRQAECKALLEVLGRQERKSVLLVAENDEVVRPILMAVASAIVAKNVPATLKGRRLIDITNPTVVQIGTLATRPQFVDMLAEAATAKEVIVFLPALDQAQECETWVTTLKPRLQDRSIQCVCRISARGYETLVKKDPSWKQLVELKHIHQKPMTILPGEL